MSQVTAPRRERKKRQTRDALLQAGLRLFLAKGYEHTAVREITDAVDVAERTFFRYFASKEDLALSVVKDGIENFAAALTSRPRDEEPLPALRSAFHATQAEIAARSGAGEMPYFSLTELISSTPALLAAQLRYVHDDDTIIRVLAERENVDPDTDPRPRLLAAVFGAVVAMATRDQQASAGARSVTEAFDRYADQLGPALAGHWSRPAA
jgi:AcrR family transcriptional regulator